MGIKKTNKYIDLNQFAKDEKGRISWKNSVGIKADFFYYNERHTIEILGYESIKGGSLKVKIDNMSSEVIKIQKLKHLNFDKLFYKPEYRYEIGDTINNVLILDRMFIDYNNNGHKSKYYKCKCLIDGYEYVVKEYRLERSVGCPVCSGNRVLVGYNDLATTDPYVVDFLLDKEDAYKYTRGSHKCVWAICPFCGYKKFVKVEDLVYNEGFLCPRCSDGFSYPNKFAFNVFSQLHEQYISYDSEYSPDWAGRMRYDNHIILNNGKEIIVEMDGGFHYNDYGKRSAQNDKIKDDLAKEHGIDVIRINCFYNQVLNRFNLIKENFIKGLKQYFDLSNIDWNYANNAGTSNRIIEVVNYYNDNPFASKQEIANHFNLSPITIRNYLVSGEELGLCKYIKNDIDRRKASVPLSLYDAEGNFIGVYASDGQMAREFKNENFVHQSINYYSRTGKQYKGYVIERITWEEYENFKNIL